MGLKKENKRVNLSKFKNPPSSKVITKIDIENLEIKNDKGTLYFKRLLYKNAPRLGARIKYGKGKFSKSTNLVLMPRKKFVIEMFELFSHFSEKETTYSTFELLVDYVRVFDKKNMVADFSEEKVMFYIDYITGKVKKGLYSVATLQKKKNDLSAILKQNGDFSLAKKLPSIKGAKKATTPHKPLTDFEFVRVGKKLMSSYVIYSQCFLAGEAPLICPLFDELQLKKDGFNDLIIDVFRRRAKQRMVSGRWENKMTSLAFLITSLWSGGNLSSLLKLKRKDVIFKKCDGDSYELDSVKARALYAKQKFGFGFTKRTKEFIENWLIISQKIDSNQDALLFPFFGEKKELKVGSNPQDVINKAIVPYGFPNITNSILRKTRSNAVMRAFNDVFVVASANHSSVGVVQSNYIHGIPDDHERSLAGAFVAQEQIARGEPKKSAIETALYKFKDPLSEFEYKQISSASLNKTSSGLRCTNPKGSQAKKSLRPFRKHSINDREACVDFLYCFQCESHAVIAEPDDIWMMISFRDTIIDMESLPSINSKPSDFYQKILNTVNAILKKFESDYIENYKKAMKLNQESSHPLYSDSNAISDLLEVYK